MVTATMVTATMVTATMVTATMVTATMVTATMVTATMVKITADQNWQPLQPLQTLGSLDFKGFLNHIFPFLTFNSLMQIVSDIEVKFRQKVGSIFS